MPSRSDVEEEPQLYGLPLILYTLLIRVAATLVGQLLLHLADRVLWTVENITLWSIPEQRLAEVTNAPQTPLVRPLSWWLFLPALLYLRFIRKACSVALWFIGIEPITPVSMVYYVQVQRKKIQLVQQSGAKVIRRRREESAKRPGIIRVIWNKLQKIISLEYIYGADREVVTVIEPNNLVNNQGNDESSEEEEETTELSLAELMEKLEKYANDPDDEEHDPDYVPEEPSSSSEDDSNVDEDEDDLEFSDDNAAHKVLNRSFLCETTRSPYKETGRSQTPPLKEGYSNLLSPHDKSTPNSYPSASKDQHAKVQNGNSVDRRKGSTAKRSNQKYRGGINNRWNIKQNNNVRKTPVISVSTNNAGSRYLNANDAAQYSMSPGAGGSAKSTQPKEMRVRDPDRHREIF